MQKNSGELVEHFFRHEYGRSIGALIRKFGTSYLEDIEECVQAAILRALESWGRRGVPDNPSAWIQSVARNAMVDRLRHQQMKVRKNRDILDFEEGRKEKSGPVRFIGEIQDDTIRSLFLCCDPRLPPRSQLALALKLVCGFGLAEIATALMQKEEAVKKRVQRGRQELKEIGLRNNCTSVESSLQSVRQVLYALFNKGHGASRGCHPIQRDVCHEALRLTQSLCSEKLGDGPESWALLAIMHFHTARLAARTDESGGLLLLAEQDRSLWDKGQIQLGLACMARSAQGEVFSRFHAEAGILFLHCQAKTYAETDWEEIVRLYLMYEKRNPSPVHTLNRAIATAEWKGPEAGLQVLMDVAPPTWLNRWYLWDATLGELYLRSGATAKAKKYFESAIANAPTDAEREHLQKKLSSCS